MDASDILNEAGIKLRTVRHGNQKTLCPECSHKRKSKRDPCLSVLVNDQGCCWVCKNCGWTGGKYYNNGNNYDYQSEGNGVVHGAGDRPGNRRTYGNLQRQAGMRRETIKSVFKPRPARSMWASLDRANRGKTHPRARIPNIGHGDNLFDWLCARSINGTLNAAPERGVGQAGGAAARG